MGRRWDGGSVSVRDKVNTGTKDSLTPSETNATKVSQGRQSRQGTKKRKDRYRDLRFHSTFDIIAAAEKGLLPDKMMITTHPQRWTDNPVEWTKELIWQNVKNVFKSWMIAWRQG